MQLAIAITTAPRPRATFAQSYASLRAAGFECGVHVLADGPGEIALPALRAAFSMQINAPPLGGLKNWAHALETLVKNTPARWLMVLEDDILWVPGAAPALERDLQKLDESTLGKRVGYLSLYLARKVSRDIEAQRGRKLSPGLYTTALGENCWGSQAYVLPRASAIALLTDPTFDDLRRNYEKNRNRDNIVSGCLMKLGRRLYYRVPCLVNHELGSANSSLGVKPVQKSLLTDYWTGKP